MKTVNNTFLLFVILSIEKSSIINISVVIIAYLRKEYLVKAVESVLDQDFDRDKYEVIVVKNFSDSFIDEYLLENRIINILSTDQQIGKKFVEGLRISTGEIVCFLEDDDIFLKNKLIEVSKVFTKHPNLIYFHNNASFIDENDVHIENFDTVTTRKISRINEVYLKNENKDNEVFNLFDLGPYWNNSCISIRKSHFIANLTTLSNVKTIFDGAIFFSALCSIGDILLTGKVLNYYRMNRNSVTQVAKFNDEAQFRISLSNLDDNVIIQGFVSATLGKKSKTFARLMADRMAWELKNLIYSKSSTRESALVYLLHLVKDHRVSLPVIKSNIFQLLSILLFLVSPEISRKSKIA